MYTPLHPSVIIAQQIATLQYLSIDIRGQVTSRDEICFQAAFPYVILKQYFLSNKIAESPVISKITVNKACKQSVRNR